jgi:hypothetical protein
MGLDPEGISMRKVLLISAAGVLAGQAEDDKAGRYTMMPTDGGFIRLDTQTGVTSICAKKGDAWACEAMPDAQQSMRDQITKLENENKSLKEENRQIEDTFGLGDPKKPEDGSSPPMSPDAGPPAPKAKIPTEQDVDRMFDYIEGMVKKFRERIDKMQKDDKKETTPL